MAWLGGARHGTARRGEARIAAGLGLAGPGWVGLGKAWIVARQGMAWLGTAGQGKVRRGGVCPTAKGGIVEFSGAITGGKLVLDHRNTYAAWLQGQKDGLRVRVKITRQKRSLSQNAFYWAVVVPEIANHTGHDNEEIHEILKAMFIGRGVKEIAGKEVICTRSSAALDTKAFSEYVDKIVAWAATDLGLTIPLPGLDNAPQNS